MASWRCGKNLELSNGAGVVAVQTTAEGSVAWRIAATAVVLEQVGCHMTCWNTDVNWTCCVLVVCTDNARVAVRRFWV